MKNKSQVILAILCFVLAAGLLWFMLQYREAGIRQSDQLQQQAERISQVERTEEDQESETEEDLEDTDESSNENAEASGSTTSRR